MKNLLLLPYKDTRDAVFGKDINYIKRNTVYLTDPLSASSVRFANAELVQDRQIHTTAKSSFRDCREELTDDIFRQQIVEGKRVAPKEHTCILVHTRLLEVDRAIDALNYFERKYGWLIYAMGIPGITLGILFLVRDQPWYIVAAPLVYSIWGAFGYFVDIYRPVQWRSPSRWSVFIPYVALFMASQFFFWIPLWYVGLGYWITYTAMYVVNTGLNIYSHRR